MPLICCAGLLAFSAGADEPAAYASTYAPLSAEPVLITNATVLTGTGEQLENAAVLIEDGEIRSVGEPPADREGLRVVDATGKWVTPGLIDVHSHLGVYASPGMQAHADGNEMTSPETPEAWAEHAVWPQDPGFNTARAGGVTTLQILPGSANLFGGRTVTVKNLPATTYQAMKFPDAPHGLKMACGENPKRVYGGRKQAPMTRMGNVAGYRAQWLKARQYQEKWQEYEAGESEKKPDRDLAMETLVGVLKGEILVHMHCYRADEMATILDLAEEFDYRVTAFHHAVQAYKVADTLAENNVCAAMWADWWGFKMEAYDGIQENIALVDRPENGCAIVHSDSAEGIQRLNQEAAKAMARGVRAGLAIEPAEAIRWLTINAARSLGVAGRTGSLEPGKMADVVVWNQNPFSVYALAEQVYVDGARVYDRDDPDRQPRSDFMLGQKPDPREQ